MTTLIVDIRRSDEVYQKRFQHSNNLKIYHIPMNMIRFNRDMIVDHLQYVDKIFIVCKSGKRSQFIKDKYFKDEDNIKVNNNLQFQNFEMGENNVLLSDTSSLKVNIIGTNKFNMYNMMRIIQTVLGLMILIMGGYTYYRIRNHKVNKIPLIILLLFGAMALYNGLTGTCTISQVFMDYLN